MARQRFAAYVGAPPTLFVSDNYLWKEVGGINSVLAVNRIPSRSRGPYPDFDGVDQLIAIEV